MPQMPLPWSEYYSLVVAFRTVFRTHTQEGILLNAHAPTKKKDAPDRSQCL